MMGSNVRERTELRRVSKDVVRQTGLWLFLLKGCRLGFVQHVCGKFGEFVGICVLPLFAGYKRHREQVSCPFSQLIGVRHAETQPTK